MEYLTTTSMDTRPPFTPAYITAIQGIMDNWSVTNPTSQFPAANISYHCLLTRDDFTDAQQDTMAATLSCMDLQTAVVPLADVLRFATLQDV
jgi:hypothetical protein